jgi:hypothetical protein
LATSDLIDYGRAIARDNGYDVGNTKAYSFSLPSEVFKEGYTTVALEIAGGRPVTYLINNATGQALEFYTCQIFDFPDLKPWQERSVQASQANPKTPKQLADEVGCLIAPTVLTKPVPIRRR